MLTLTHFFFPKKNPARHFQRGGVQGDGTLEQGICDLKLLVYAALRYWYMTGICGHKLLVYAVLSY